MEESEEDGDIFCGLQDFETSGYEGGYLVEGKVDLFGVGEAHFGGGVVWRGVGGLGTGVWLCE